MYRLIGYGPLYNTDAEYPRFKISKDEESIHRTFEDAFERMRELAIPVEGSWQGFHIIEVPVGINCFGNSLGQRNWSYDCKGEFVAESKVSSVADIDGNCEIYWGREKEECRFRPGDIVEVHCRNEVQLCVVLELPINEERAREKMPDSQPDVPFVFHLDDTDDNYSVIGLDDIFPDNYEVMSCFPARTLPLDESIVKRLMDLYEIWKKHD